MKKIFLLTLLSVFFLSAFCQTTISNTEVLTKISIIRSEKDIPLDTRDIRQANEFIELPEGYDAGFSWPSWWPLYKTVTVQPLPGGGYKMICTGNGWKLCFPPLRYLINWPHRGVAPETMETVCTGLVAESEEQVARGVYTGSLTKKLAAPNLKDGYFLFKMDWNYDPQNPRNGQAEITISITNDFGLRTN